MPLRVLLLAPPDDARCAARARWLRDAGEEVVLVTAGLDASAVAAVAVQEDVARVEVEAARAPGVRRALTEAGAADVEVAELPRT